MRAQSFATVSQIPSIWFITCGFGAPEAARAPAMITVQPRLQAQRTVGLMSFPAPTKNAPSVQKNTQTHLTSSINPSTDGPNRPCHFRHSWMRTGKTQQHAVHASFQTAQWCHVGEVPLVNGKGGTVCDKSEIHQELRTQEHVNWNWNIAKFTTISAKCQRSWKLL